MQDTWRNPKDKERFEENKLHAIKHISRTHRRKKRKIKIKNKIKCDYCGKLIEQKPSQVKLYKNHFCSKFHHDLFRRNDKLI